MPVEFVQRTVAVLACATAVGLLTTITAVASVNAMSLKWDGTMCRGGYCGNAFAGLPAAKPRPVITLAAASF
ncbi:MAG: hypothetical protein AB7O43_00900 [Hyphomicrobiaceae bacterium]